MPKTNTKTAETDHKNGAKAAPSVLDIFQDAWDAIPEDEYKAMPEDGAEQIDHYIYGTPKRQT